MTMHYIVVHSANLLHQFSTIDQLPNLADLSSKILFHVLFTKVVIFKTHRDRYTHFPDFHARLFYISP